MTSPHSKNYTSPFPLSRFLSVSPGIGLCVCVCVCVCACVDVCLFGFIRVCRANQLANEQTQVVQGLHTYRFLPKTRQGAGEGALLGTQT